VSLIHIRRAGVPSEDIYCGHPAPDLWNYSEEDASCADCIKLYLQEGVDEYRKALTGFVMNRGIIDGPTKLWVVTDQDMTRAEVLLGMLEKKS
jgi:hypothetical protein